MKFLSEYSDEYKNNTTSYYNETVSFCLFHSIFRISKFFFVLCFDINTINKPNKRHTAAKTYGKLSYNIYNPSFLHSHIYFNIKINECQIIGVFGGLWGIFFFTMLILILYFFTNLYCIMLQRYTRLRIKKIFKKVAHNWERLFSFGAP